MPTPEDATTTLELERQRLAALLTQRVAEPLALLLAQGTAYEAAFTTQPQAHMAISVLNSLARQLLQQVRDLSTALDPTILETLGLEPALEALTSQVMRTHGVAITLTLARLPQRLPPPLALALFRATQELLDHATTHAHASRILLRLIPTDTQLTLTYLDNGTTAVALLPTTRPHLEALGAIVQTSATPLVGHEASITLRLAPPAQLTTREFEVLYMLAEGLSNKAIAARLHITPRTVNYHLDNIYTKLGVNSRTEALLYAIHQGWLKSSP